MPPNGDFILIKQPTSNEPLVLNNDQNALKTLLASENDTENASPDAMSPQELLDGANMQPMGFTETLEKDNKLGTLKL